jgi:hypothetical protein
VPRQHTERESEREAGYKRHEVDLECVYDGQRFDGWFRSFRMAVHYYTDHCIA